MDEANFKGLIVVPFRDREENLAVFAPYLEEYLTSVDVKVLIVNQEEGAYFNRAKLCNIGFDFSKDNFDYFIFHDVDLLPLEVDYSYADKPTHLARRLDYLGYKPCYADNFGGVTLFDKESFVKVNGFSNEYWGWGGEDDDLRMRCVREGLTLGYRPGMFKSIPHPESTPAPGEAVNSHPHYQQNNTKFWTFARNPQDHYYRNEGLTTLKYEVLQVEKTPRYTKITVSV